MTDDLISHALEELFAAERTAPTIDAATRAGLRARLSTTVGKAALGHAAAGTALGGAGKALAVIAITVATGGGIVAVVHHDAARHRATAALPRIAHVTAPAWVAAPTPPPTATPPITPPAAAPTPIHTRRQPDLPSPPSPPSEPALVRDAWAALSANEPARALDLARADELAHPRGALTEEREALQIVALAKLGRLDEAKAAAAAFQTLYPSSVHRELVQRAINQGAP